MQNCHNGYSFGKADRYRRSDFDAVIAFLYDFECSLNPFPCDLFLLFYIFKVNQLIFHFELPEMSFLLDPVSNLVLPARFCHVVELVAPRPLLDVKE